MAKKYFEYRGIADAVYAEVVQDDSNGFVTGEVKEFTGVAEIAKTTESSNDPHYYDNIPAIIISSTGADELSINASGIPFDVLADITGQYYDAQAGVFVEQERTPKNFAFGYRTQKTDGSEVFVWRLKGSFSIPEQTSTTQDSGTDANGQTLTFTGISTTYKFEATGKPAKAVNVDTSVNETITAEAFFATVMTPDTVGGSVAVEGVGLTPSTLTLGTKAKKITATVEPATATNKAVTFASSDTAVATVSEAGVVTPVANGSATITVTTEDGGFTDTCAVTVSQ